MIGIGLLVAAAVLAFAIIRTDLGAADEPAPSAERPAVPARVAVERCLHCGVTGPQVHPR
jgi:hypothetical protein